MNSFVLLFKKNTSTEFRIRLRKIRRYFLYWSQSLIGLKTKKECYCPISEKSYLIFLKDGKSLKSLDFGARERHRFIWHYLKNNTNIFSTPDLKLLHISPEYCFYQKFKDIKNIQYSPVDYFEPGYDYLPLTKEFNLLDVKQNDKGGGEFDFFICNHVLEHIIEDKKAISNLFKLLKPGGNGILSVPILPNNAPTFEDYSITSPKERKKHFGQWDHVRYYGLDIIKRFEDSGFEVKTISSKKYFTSKECEIFGTPNETYLFHLTKPKK